MSQDAAQASDLPASGERTSPVRRPVWRIASRLLPFCYPLLAVVAMTTFATWRVNRVRQARVVKPFDGQSSAPAGPVQVLGDQVDLEKEWLNAEQQMAEFAAEIGTEIDADDDWEELP